MTESLFDSETNRKQRECAEIALVRLLRESLVRQFNGDVDLTLKIKQGTIQAIETVKRERL